ncbi:MAG: TonB-dependent receptor, partial [Flavobacteriia bacterium]
MINVLRYPIFLFFFLTITVYGYSQDDYATVRGSVYEKKTQQPVLYTNVQLEGTSYGAVTDVNGHFTISKVVPGSYTILITYIGFDTLRKKVTLKAGEVHYEKFVLKKGAYDIEGATISAGRQTRQLDPTTSITKITPKQLKQLPAIGGQADIAQYLQVVPGVVFTGDQGGQLYIRGGTPVQNLVLLDGMTVYNPFHSIGLFSVFDADIISNADVYTGGFGAEYGGRISSVMDISTRYGNPVRQSGKVDVNTFGMKLLLEGPLVKAKDDNSNSISYILSAKKSYIDKTSKTIYPYVNNGSGLPFTFSDFYGKLSFNSANGSRADIFGFNFNDQVSYRSIQNYEWKSYGGGMKFAIVPGSSPTLISGNVSYSNYRIELVDGSLNPRSSEIGGFNMGLDFTYFLGKNKLKYGV